MQERRGHYTREVTHSVEENPDQTVSPSDPVSILGPRDSGRRQRPLSVTELLGSSPHWGGKISHHVSQLKSPGPVRAAAGVEECTVHP